MYHSTRSQRSKVFERSVVLRRDERLRKEREKLTKALKSEKLSFSDWGEEQAAWNAAIDRAIKVVNEELR
jgi:hypothetical protein